MDEQFESLKPDFSENWDFDTDGPTIIGKFLETKKVVNDKTGPKGMIVHYLDVDGDRYSVKGAGNLNWWMKDVSPGDRIRIKFNGWGKMDLDGSTVRVRRFSVGKAKVIDQEDYREKAKV